MKPIVKWVGGKQGNLKYIKELLPSTYNKYYEPFFGGGAVLFGLIDKDKPAVINDINPELVNLYNQVKTNPTGVIRALEAMDYNHNNSSEPKEYYYTIRDLFNIHLGSNTDKQAARFIYLNKHCFNGLYRVNKKGEFNVPFNGKVSGDSVDNYNFWDVCNRLQDVELKCGDFADTVKDASEGDLVFFDSPYAPLTPTSFVDYTKEGFSYDDHVRLADLYNQLTDRGVYCMLTNHDTDLIRTLYKDYNITEVDVSRSINRNGSNRKGKEVIITNY